MTRYTVLASINGSPYINVTYKGPAGIFLNVPQCKQAINVLTEKNHLLPSQIDYIIFKEVPKEEIEEIEELEA
jgi:hypothetical protein